MIFSESRFPVFGTMLYGAPRASTAEARMLQCDLENIGHACNAGFHPFRMQKFLRASTVVV
jgi:hypothetical protein